MPTPVNNTPGGTGTGGEPVTGNTTLKVSVKSNSNSGHGNNAIHQLNARIGNNSQTAPPNRAGNALHHAQDGQQNNPDAPETRGNNGNHFGQLKNGKQGQPTTVNTPPIIDPQNQTPKAPTANLPTVNTPPFNPRQQNPPTNLPPVNTPPIIQNPNQTNHPQWTPPVIITIRTFNPNTPNGVLRNAVVEILRQNDIYLSRSVINNLVGNQNSHGNNKALNIPAEVRLLVQTVANQLSNTLNNSTPPSPQFIAANLDGNFQPTANADQCGAKCFALRDAARRETFQQFEYSGKSFSRRRTDVPASADGHESAADFKPGNLQRLDAGARFGFIKRK